MAQAGDGGFCAGKSKSPGYPGGKVVLTIDGRLVADRINRDRKWPDGYDPSLAKRHISLVLLF